MKFSHISPGRFLGSSQFGKTQHDRLAELTADELLTSLRLARALEFMTA